MDSLNLNWETPRDLLLKSGVALDESLAELAELKMSGFLKPAKNRVPTIRPEKERCVGDMRNVCSSFPIYLIFQCAAIDSESTTTSWVPPGLKVSEILYPQNEDNTLRQESSAVKLPMELYEEKFSNEICQLRLRDNEADRTREETRDDEPTTTTATEESILGNAVWLQTEKEIKASVKESAWKWLNLPSNNVRISHAPRMRFLETLTCELDDMDKGWFR